MDEKQTVRVEEGEATGGQVLAVGGVGDGPMGGGRMLAGTYATYRRMLADPTIALARAVATAPLLASPWSYECKDGTPDAWVHLVRDALEPLQQKLKKDCLRAWDMGWQPFELVWKSRRTSPEEGLPAVVVTYERIKPLLPDIATPLVDQRGRLVGLRNGRVLSPGELPADKVWVYVYDQEGDDYFGRSRLENCREDWNDWRAANDNARRLSRKAAGTVAIGHYPLGESEDAAGNKISNYKATLQVLTDIVAGKAVAVPNLFAAEENLRLAANLAGESAFKFDFLDAGNTGPAQAGLIDERKYKDARMMRGYFTPERAATEAARSGSRADAGSAADIATLISDLSGMELVESINRGLVDPLLMHNFGPQARGAVYLTAGKLSASLRQFFQSLFVTLLGNPAMTDAMARMIDLDAMLDALEVPKSSQVVDSAAARTDTLAVTEAAQRRRFEESVVRGFVDDQTVSDRVYAQVDIHELLQRVGLPVSGGGEAGHE